jgi:hypothetical protein
MTAGVWPYSSLHPLHNAILPSNYCDFVTSSAIHFHSSLKSIPDGCSAFSQIVHHSSFTAFAALGGLITPPEQRYRYANPLFSSGLYHLNYNISQSFS